MLLEIAILLAVVTIGYVIFDLFYTQKKRKKEGRVIRILLFEHVGNDKVFRGYKKGLEVNDEQLGLYIEINKSQKYAISGVNNSDYFVDDKLGKCLLVCKYADDDFRVMTRLRDDVFYKRVQKNPEDYLEADVEVDEETGEKKVTLKKDEEGEYIRKVDEDGQEYPEYDLEAYREPLGVNQNGREAMRFNRSFAKRMQEKRNQGSGFWDKYGSMVISIIVVFIMFLSLAYTVNKTTEAQKEISKQFGEKAEDIVDAVNSPTFAEQMLRKYEEKKKNDEAPPS